jgi:trimeric autotransporter adhesin
LNARVFSLVVSGTELYAGGQFTSTDTVNAYYVARWNGISWSGVGNGTNGVVRTLFISGTLLYTGGNFSIAGGNPAANLARWDGVGWAEVAGGASNQVLALTGGSGALYAGGAFAAVNSTLAARVARLDGAQWAALGSGVCCANSGNPSHVDVIQVHGTDVYVGGSFFSIGALPANNIVKWNSMTNTWSPLGKGIDEEVLTIAISGTDVYAGGRFLLAGGNFSLPGYSGNNCCIARWDGANWLPIGTGADNSVYTIATAGNGAYIGGIFTMVDGHYANRVAKWNGSVWSALGDESAPNGNGANGTVYALATSGNDVYVAGNFSVVHPADFVDVNAAHIARWDGSTWSALGGGVGGSIYAVATTANKVYAAGSFSNAGGNPANNIAQWDGSNWSALGSGLQAPLFSRANALAGDGRGVYAGGYFTSAGNKPSINVAYWLALANALYLPLTKR